VSKLMVSVSGVRGIVGDGLTPEVILNFSQGFGEYMKGGKVVLGSDSRVTGPLLKNAVTAGLLSVGCDVIDIGICPTPTTQMTVEHLRAAGAIMITASHNPIMWNGLKLIGHDGLFLDAEQGGEVLRIAESGVFSFRSWDQIGIQVSYSKAVAEHQQAILDLPYINQEQIRGKKFRVVVDCVAGAGSVICPELLQKLGCEVIELHCEPTGLFPRDPEPLPESLGEICAAVKKHGADLGVVVDPDSDRLALISEKGEPLGEERTLALAVKFILGKKNGPVVINASTSRATEDVAIDARMDVIRTKVGEINVAKKMREIGAVIGGEGNGGVILPDLHLGRDAPVGIALTLQHLAEFGGAMSQLNDTIPHYSIVKDKVELGSIEPEDALKKIAAAYQSEKLDFTDGVKIIRNKSWVHVRPSNTEPIIRVIAEAPTKAEARRVCDELKGKI